MTEKNVIRRLMQLGFFVFGLSMLSGCDFARQVTPLAESSVLVVAVRVSPVTFNPDSDERLMPFEHELLLRFSEKIDKKLKIVPLRSYLDVIEYVAAGKAHLGAAWFSPTHDPRITPSQPFHTDQLVLVQQDASIAISSVDDLAGKTVHVASGSVASATLEQIRKDKIASLTLIERPDGSGLGLLRSVAKREIEFTVTSQEVASVAQNYYPETQLTAEITAEQPVVWLTATSPNNETLKLVNDFLTEIEASGKLDRIKDARFSFHRRLNQMDRIKFIERTRMILPQYQALFKQAQIRTEIDWRLIAALAYQESQWDPNATSPTSVRGMMMLTAETADRLNVTNRLDPVQSILAGADYLADLRDELPPGIKEPDRTWMAMAAYNIGMGHMRGALTLAPSYELDPMTWQDMKKMLPKMTRPEVYARLKSGRARGGEAVILVENVRAFYDILSRHLPSYRIISEKETVAAIHKAPVPPRKKRKARRLHTPKPQAAPTSAASRM